MDRRRLLTGGVALAAALPAAQVAFAQEAMEMGEMEMAVLEAGTFSMMTSQLALEKGQSDAVRVFAELESAEQMAVARAFGAEGAEIPLREDHQAIMEQLQAAEGAEFDTLYLDTQIAAHEEGRPIFEQYSEEGSMEMGRGATMVGVPSIDTHLVMLRSFREQVQAG
jgi:putative membrane protein